MNLANLRGPSLGLVHSLAIAGLMAFSAPAISANYPLELISPRATGTAPSAGGIAISGTHRIFKAYPGLEYNIRAVVIGGAFPYTFALSNAPSGMSIDARTGVISWPNPQANATPTITVTDLEGSRVSSSWAITVTTDGFRFLDAVNGRSHPTGTGTAANPWRTISDLVHAPVAVAGDIVYFRAGTYDALDLPRTSVGTAWERVEFYSSETPSAWLAYPGQTPTINFGFTPGGEPGVLFRLNGDNFYIDGLETRNSRIIGFQLGHGSYNVLRRLRMRDHNVIGANLDGTNAAFIMSITGGQSAYGHYTAIQDNDFSNAQYDLGLKIYSQGKLLIESNIFRDVWIGTELKADIPQFTYRANDHFSIGRGAVGGNMHYETTYGEILFNLARVPSGDYAVDVNQDGMAKRIDIYRNTFIGRVRVRETDSVDGPFYLYNNVIVNTDAGTPVGSHVYHLSVSDPSRIRLTDNLVGYPSDGIVDAGGSLTSAFQQYLGSRGYQIGGTASRPLPPSQLVIE